MPNHLHGILWITKSINCESQARQFGKMTASSISGIILSCKAIVTKKINQICQQKRISLIWHKDPDYSTCTDILWDLPF